MSKKKITWDEKTVKLDKESYGKLKELLNSPDKENHVMAFGVMENLQIKPNLVYFMLLYKRTKDNHTEGWKNMTPKLEKALKGLGMAKIDDRMQQLWETFKGVYPREDKQVLIDEAITELKSKFIEAYGWKYINEIEWEPIVR